MLCRLNQGNGVAKKTEETENVAHGLVEARSSPDREGDDQANPARPDATLI